MDNAILARAMRKASSSSCRYKVAAVGFDKRGNLLGILTSVPHLHKAGGSIHAEVRAIQALNGLKTITLVRVTGASNNALKPIHPCPNCQDYAKRHNVTINTFWTRFGGVRWRKRIRIH